LCWGGGGGGGGWYVIAWSIYSHVPKLLQNFFKTHTLPRDIQMAQTKKWVLRIPEDPEGRTCTDTGLVGDIPFFASEVELAEKTVVRARLQQTLNGFKIQVVDELNKVSLIDMANEWLEKELDMSVIWVVNVAIRFLMKEFATSVNKIPHDPLVEEWNLHDNGTSWKTSLHSFISDKFTVFKNSVLALVPDFAQKHAEFIDLHPRYFHHREISAARMSLAKKRKSTEEGGANAQSLAKSKNRKTIAEGGAPAP